MRIIPIAMAIVFSFGAVFALAVDISSANPEAAAEIRTVLPLDAILSIDNTTFVSVGKAKKFMAPDEMVIGLDINGDRWAYSVPWLSSHEIVNDLIGGKKSRSLGDPFALRPSCMTGCWTAKRSPWAFQENFGKTS